MRPCSHAQCGLAGLSDAVDRSRNPQAARPQSDDSRITIGLQSDIQSDYSRTTVFITLSSHARAVRVLHYEHAHAYVYPISESAIKTVVRL